MKNYTEINLSATPSRQIKDGEMVTPEKIPVFLDAKLTKPVKSNTTFTYNSQYMVPLYVKVDSGLVEFKPNKYYVVLQYDHSLGIIFAERYASPQYCIKSFNEITKGNMWSVNLSYTVSFEEIMLHLKDAGFRLFECNTFSSIFELLKDLKSQGYKLSVD